jgi:hypothetical protein
MDTARVIITPVGLLSDEERSSVRYTFSDATRAVVASGDSTSGVAVRCDPSTGEVRFERVFEREGEYHYTVRCEVKRSIPDFYPAELHTLIWDRLNEVPRVGEYLHGTGRDFVVTTLTEYPFRILVRSEGIKIPPCPQCGF